MTQFKPTSLTASKMIVHELTHEQLRCSDDCSLFPKDVQSFFVSRTVSALKTASAIVRGNNPSPVPAVIEDLLQHPKKDIVDPSQEIAKRLHEVHRQTHSEGLLCVLRCESSAGTGITVIKLEKSDGVRATFDEKSKRFDIDVIDDLLFTKNTNLYKVAFFGLDSKSNLIGLLTDNQTSRYAIPANYYLDSFLGCKLRDDPEVTTRTFFETAMAYVNELNNAESQAKYATALYAEMNSTDGSVTPDTFAKKHLDLADRATFLQRIEGAGVATKTPFTKDVSQIRTRIKRVRFVFQDGSDVLAEPRSLKDGTISVEKKGEKTLLQIEEKLAETRGSS